MKSNKLLPIIAALLCTNSVAAQMYTLDQCRRMALEHNVKIRNGRLDQQIASQSAKEAFTRYFPQVSAAGTLFRSSDPMVRADIALPSVPALSALGFPTSMPFEMLDRGKVAGVAAMLPLYAGGQIVNGNRLARVGKEASASRMILTRNEVVATTERYFWQIVALKEKLRTIEAAEAQLAALSKNVKSAVDAGITTRNDLLRVELQQQRTASDRLRVENGLRVSKLLLAHQTGIETHAFDIAFGGFPAVEPPDRYYVSPEEGVDRRAETRLLESQVEAAKYRKRLALGKNLPTVGVGAGYLYHDLTAKDTDFGMVFASVSVPISAWWGGSHALRRERLKQQQAENDRDDARGMMLVEIESKWSELQEAYSRILIAEKSILSAAENLRLNEAYFRAGTVSLSDLLDAQTLLQQSRDLRTDACTAYYDKLTAYLQATGR